MSQSPKTLKPSPTLPAARIVEAPASEGVRPRVVLQVEWGAKHHLKARLDRDIEAATVVSIDDSEPMTLCEHFGANLDHMLLSWKKLPRRDAQQFAKAAADVATEHVKHARHILQTFAISGPEPMVLVRAGELFNNNTRTIGELLEILLFHEGKPRPGDDVVYFSATLDRTLAGLVSLRAQNSEDLAEVVELKDEHGRPVRYDSGVRGEVKPELVAQAMRLRPEAVRAKIQRCFQDLSANRELARD